VAGVELGQRLSALGHLVAGDHRSGDAAGIDAELTCEGFVDRNQRRIGHWIGVLPGKEMLRQSGVCVVKYRAHASQIGAPGGSR
jgi:hypothetical protein